MSGDLPKDHPLTLKVMRLTKPSFGSVSFSTWAKDIDLNDHTPQQEKSCPNFMISESLLLPQSIENIYLGETFSCYICLHNDSAELVNEISLKVDLQTSSQRIGLQNQFQTGCTELEPGSSLGEVVNHEVKELGQHILVCAVTYAKNGATTSDNKAYFRKFFKFPVAKPLDVRTKFYNAESDDVYLEAQVQNTSHLPMVLERVALEPSELYTAEQMSFENTVATSCKLNFIKPNDTRQYLFRLKPDKKQALKAYRGVTQVGKIDMVWFTTNGERGRLQTSQLQRIVPGSGDLRLIVDKVPNTVKLGDKFCISFRLHNCVGRTLDLLISVENSLNRGIIWHEGQENTLTGQVEAELALKVSLELVAEKVGLYAISGVRVKDTLLDRLYEFDEIAQTFVYS